MATRLTVTLSRGEGPAVDAPESFEASGPFEVVLDNRGPPAHVHLRTDERLERAVRVPTGNHFVPGESTRGVEVAVDGAGDGTTGTLEVLTGYGAEAAAVEVTVRDPPTVAVDEALAEPSDDPPDDGLDLRESLPVVGAATALVVLVVLALALVDETLALAVGGAAVLVGALAGGVFLARRR